MIIRMKENGGKPWLKIGETLRENSRGGISRLENKVFAFAKLADEVKERTNFIGNQYGKTKPSRIIRGG